MSFFLKIAILVSGFLAFLSKIDYVILQKVITSCHYSHKLSPRRTEEGQEKAA
jgi:hypothetical protein